MNIALSTDEQVARLRLALTRTARRLRQQAGQRPLPLASAPRSRRSSATAPVTPSELAEAERVQRPTATRVIARLAEAEGLVERTADPRRQAGRRS